MIRLWIAVLCCVACNACAHHVRQSSLVPPPVLPLGPVKEQGGYAYLSDDTVAFVTRPEREPSNDSALWITRHLVRAAFGMQMNQSFGWHLIGAYGLSEGAFAAMPTNMQNPGGGVVGFGGGGNATAMLGDHRLYAGLDLVFLSVPSYFESTTSEEDEGWRRSGGGHQREIVPQAVAMVGYGYELARWLTIHALAALQNHPTNSASFESLRARADVRMGPANLTAGLSLDLSVLPWLAVVPSIQLPITRSPVRYGPIMGVALRGSFAGLTTP